MDVQFRLCGTWSETLKTDFLTTRLLCYCKSTYFRGCKFFAFLSSLAFSQWFIFTDCRTVLGKNIGQYVYLDIYAAIFFLANSSFSRKSQKWMAHENKLIYSILLLTPDRLFLFHRFARSWRTSTLMPLPPPLHPRDSDQQHSIPHPLHLPMSFLTRDIYRKRLAPWGQKIALYR